MSEKGNSKKEMLDRFKGMGIPVPMKPIVNPKSKSNDPEKSSRIDEIRNGGLKNSFAKFIEKSEKTSTGPVAIPVPKVGKSPNEKSKNAPKLNSFAPKSNSEASMIDDIMYGDSIKASNYSQSSEIENFGPSNLDTKSILQARLKQKQEESQDVSLNNEKVVSINLTEAELNEKITNISKSISKKMIKSVLLEMSKSSGGLIVESKNVKKAEIVAKNKVKIGGKIYKLTLDK
jgi:hypothetical protein